MRHIAMICDGVLAAMRKRGAASSSAFGFECEPLSTREESSQAYVEASYERLQQYLCVLKNLPCC